MVPGLISRSRFPLPLALSGALLTGCGLGVATPPTPDPVPGTALTGRVHGGQQPVGQARIGLYAAGNAGPGAGAVDLLAGAAVRSDDFGNFNITGAYTCPNPRAEVYLVASGGNPGLAAGTNNRSLLMMSALGDCANLTPATFIDVDEVSTVAAAWALQQFLRPGAQVGASGWNAAGLRNAFLSVANLVDGSRGTAPGPALPAGAATEVLKINTLADALAPCVNSYGGAGCDSLFAAAGLPPGTPSNTLDAALAIVSHPGANVAAVFAAVPAQAPFQPVLASSPSDWTLSVTYGACSVGCGGLNQPAVVAVDSVGSVWVANYFGAVLSKFTSTGAAVAPNGFPGAGLLSSYGVAIDAYDNVWVSNEQSVTAAANSHLGSISRFSSTGAELSGFGYTAGGVYYPQGMAFDRAGELWIADYGDSSASFLANSGVPISPPSGFGYFQLPTTSAVAVDAAGNGWFSVQQAAVRVSPAGALSRFGCCVDPAGIAIDPAGNVWLADYGAASIVELNSAGTVLNTVRSPSGANAAEGIAVDGAGNVWAANFRGNSLTEIAAANAASLSPSGGFGLDAPLNEPLGIAIDASGNLWMSNNSGNTLTEMIGLAAPVRTPIAGPPAAP